LIKSPQFSLVGREKLILKIIVAILDSHFFRIKMGKKYSTSYAKLTNLILQMSNYHRSKLFDIAEYMQRDPMRRIYYGSKRKKVVG